MTTPSPLATPLAWNFVSKDYAAEIVPQFEPYAKDALELALASGSGRVLDVACGPGTLALLAARTSTEVEAIDFSPDMIAELERRVAQAGVANVQARVGDGQALPFEDASFDAAFSMFGLIFFPDRARGFSELRRVLRPGRRAVVSSWLPFDSVPLLTCLFRTLQELMPDLPFGKSKAPLGQEAEMCEEMIAAGFSRVSVHQRTHATEAPSLEALWASIQRTLAPLVLLQKTLGAERWRPVAEGIYAGLAREVGEGAQRIEMPAWLGVGEAT